MSSTLCLLLSETVRAKTGCILDNKVVNWNTICSLQFSMGELTFDTLFEYAHVIRGECVFPCSLKRARW